MKAKREKRVEGKIHKQRSTTTSSISSSSSSSITTTSNSSSTSSTSNSSSSSSGKTISLVIGSLSGSTNFPKNKIFLKRENEVARSFFFLELSRSFLLF
jgi:hypothetical protein